MKMISIFFLFIAVCIGIYVLKMQPKESIPNRPVKVMTIGNTQLQVEVATTTQEITKGLGYRNSLGSDGMLFVFTTKHIPTFWMKGMRFDLDFVWIDTNIVVDITEQVSAQVGVPDAQLSTYSPKTPVTHVLEMNAGEVAKRSIKIGDTVTLP